MEYMREHGFRPAALMFLLLLLCVARPVCAFAEDAPFADAAEPVAAGQDAGVPVSADVPAAGVPVSADEIAGGIAFCAEFPVSLVLDGVPVESAVPPVVIRERTLIPARAVFESMGASVSWNEELRQVGVTTAGAVILLTVDAFEYAIDGNIYTADVPPLIIDERTMIPVRIVAEAMGCDIKWDDLARTVSVTSPVPESPPEGFAYGSEYPEQQDGAGLPASPEQGGQEGLPASPEVSRGGAARDGAAGTLPRLSPEFAGFSVVIDAGHGGVDSGALGEENGRTVLFEKDVNLDVALRLRDYLGYAGFSVHMIRSGDDTVDRYARPQIANGLGAQLYISIHNNSSTKPSVSGTSTYYYNKEWAAGYPLDSETLAVAVQKSVSAYAGLPDLGIHDGPEYIVLNRTQMPAIIVEGAFLSNASDRALMATDAYREAYAFGVATGLINALNGRATAPVPAIDGMMPIGL
jgi:N-acetylmuramoyl-L-alanine amidase